MRYVLCWLSLLVSLDVSAGPSCRSPGLWDARRAWKSEDVGRAGEQVAARVEQCASELYSADFEGIPLSVREARRLRKWMYAIDVERSAEDGALAFELARLRVAGEIHLAREGPRRRRERFPDRMSGAWRSLATFLNNAELYEEELLANQRDQAMMSARFGAEAPLTLSQLRVTGRILSRLGQHEEAITIHEAILAAQRDGLTPHQFKRRADQELYDQLLRGGLTLSDTPREIMVSHKLLADAFHGADRLDEALEHRNQALSIARSLGEPSLDVSLALVNRALVYQSMDRWREALTDLDAAVAMNARLLAADPDRGAASLFMTAALDARLHRGGVLRDMARYDASIEELEAVVAAWEAHTHPGDTKVLGAKETLASALLAAGRVEDAQALYREVLAQELEGVLPKPRASRLRGWASAQWRAGYVHEAIQGYEEALQTLEAAGLERLALHRLIRNELALALSSVGEHHRALVMTQALVVESAALSQEDQAITYNNQASVFNKQGRLAEAIEAQERAVLLSAGRDVRPQTHASLLSSYGSMLDRAGRSEEALVPLEEALAIQRHVYGDSHGSVLVAMNNLGMAQLNLRMLEAAEASHRAVLQAREASLAPHHPDRLLSMSNLAAVLSASGRLEEAIALERGALEAADAANLGQAELLRLEQNLASSLALSGALEEALAMQEGSLARALARAEVAPLHPNHLTWRSNIADTRIRLGLARLAAGDRSGLALAEQAIAEREALLSDLEGVLGIEHERTGREALQQARASWGLSRALRVAGALAEAEEAARRARTSLARADPAVLASRQRAAVLGLELRQIAGAEMAWEAHRLALAVAPERAWSYALSARGWAVDPATGRRCQLAVTPEDAASCDCARRARLARAALPNLSTSQAAGLAACLEDTPAELVHRDAASAVRRVEASAAATLGGALASPPEPAAVSAALDDGEALVEFFRYSPVTPPGTPRAAKRYGAYLLLPGAEARFVDLGPAEPIESLVDAWLAPMHHTGRGLRGVPRAVGAALEEALWGPLAPVASAERLYLIPDGALAALPLEALEPDNPREIVYLSAAADLLTAPSPLGEGSLVLTQVRYGGADIESESEAEAVASRGAAGCPRSGWGVLGGGVPLSGGDVEYLRGAEATEEGLLEGVAGRRLVHLDTHACFGDSGDPLGDGVVVLAGANDGRLPGADDGYLSAWELLYAPLEGVELVVFAACESARGRALAPGQSGLGLRFAALHAGAGAALGGLWQVDDQATSRFFEVFYVALGAGATPSEALRQARDALRADPRYAHPYYWAAWTIAARY